MAWKTPVHGCEKTVILLSATCTSCCGCHDLKVDRRDCIARSGESKGVAAAARKNRAGQGHTHTHTHTLCLVTSVQRCLPSLSDGGCYSNLQEGWEEREERWAHMLMWDVDLALLSLCELMRLVCPDGEFCVAIPAHGALVDVGRPDDDVLQGNHTRTDDQTYTSCRYLSSNAVRWKKSWAIDNWALLQAISIQ